mmetsp:Transcript_48848/g.73823  ORF Transcript_48848/g.73823 Transcript_48848/m.73823 type:complete len:337 (-) Transcript_48848:2817-3827(-)
MRQSFSKPPRIHNNISSHDNDSSENNDEENDNTDNDDDISSISSMPLEDKLEEIQYLQEHDLSLKRVKNAVQTTSKMVGKSIQAHRQSAFLHVRPKILANHIRAQYNVSVVDNVNRQEREMVFGRNQHRRSLALDAKRIKEYCFEKEKEKIRVSQIVTDQIRQSTNTKHENDERKKRIREFLNRRGQEKEKQRKAKLEEERLDQKRKEETEKERRVSSLKYWAEKAREFQEETEKLSKQQEERRNVKSTAKNGVVLLVPSDDSKIEQSQCDKDEGIIEKKGNDNTREGPRGIYRASSLSEWQDGALKDETRPDVDLFSKTFSIDREEKRCVWGRMC